jgi:CBS domain-containing protein
MNGSGTRTAVIEEDGAVVGMITAEDLATVLQIRRESGSSPSPRVAM